MCTDTLEACACLAMLVSDSWTIRNTVSSALRGQANRLELQPNVDAQALRELAAEHLERGLQAQRIEGGRPQVLDDAALERDAAVQRLDQVLDAGCQFGRGAVQLGADPRHVELGRGEQCTEFVVQVAREARPFVLARGLEVTRQFGQFGGALANLALEPVVFSLHALLLFAALPVELAALVQEHHQQQQAENGERSDAAAVEQQDVEDAGQRCGDAAVLGGEQFVGREPYIGHAVTGHLLRHQCACLLGGFGVVESNHLLERRQLVVDAAGHLLQARPRCRVGKLVVDRTEPLQTGIHLAPCSQDSLAAAAAGP